MWLTVAVTCGLLAVALPLILAPVAGPVSGMHEDSPWPAVTVTTLVLTALMTVAGYALWHIPSWRFSPWTWGILAICLAIAAIAAIFTMEWNVNLGPIMVVMLGLFALAIVALFHAIDPNPYQVTHGRVVQQAFDPGDADDGTGPSWLLLVEQCDAPDPCRQGWLYFNQDVFGSYPVGSNYPTPQ